MVVVGGRGGGWGGGDNVVGMGYGCVDGGEGGGG